MGKLFGQVEKQECLSEMEQEVRHYAIEAAIFQSWFSRQLLLENWLE